ncbi:hypothetical protein VaNZ11_009756 [Volvox africanus]|uniref:FK506-binding protein n=1 Tax=Volvox africanus TaxID=51714 RepID=A0ABQ5S873_9CHLO|nr:hypothetical protein VaNZ11_009756 [Volvox africanus]
MAFWSAIVKPGKPHAFVPPPEEWNLHLSQAALAPTVPEGRRVALAVKTDPEDEAIIICTLAAGRGDTAVLDLFFSQYTEFFVIGEHELYLTGYYTPSQLLDGDDEGEDEDEDSEYQPGALGFPVRAGDDEGDDEDEDEDDELDGLGEDEDEDEESMDGDDEEELFGYEAMLRSKRKPHVVIEDVTDHAENNKDRKGAAAASEPAAGDKKAKVSANAGNTVKVEAKEDSEESEEDEEGEEDDEDEGEDDEDDEDEGEEEEEEEEEQDTPAQKGGKAQAPTASGKRPLDAVKPTANGTSKVDGPTHKKHAVGQQQQPQAQPVSKPHDKRQKAEAKQQQDERPARQVLKQQEGATQQEPKQQQKEKETKAGKKNIRSHPNGFTIEDVSYGDPKGKLAKLGQKVAMRYVGRLKANGKEFDRSGKQPFRFRLGVGEVIKGWDFGVEGMRVGDKRRLVIPPQLAYGTTGVKGTIPPNATLEFDVELLEVK